MIPSSSASISQASPIPSPSASSCPELGVSLQLSCYTQNKQWDYEPAYQFVLDDDCLEATVKDQIFKTPFKLVGKKKSTTCATSPMYVAHRINSP